MSPAHEREATDTAFSALEGLDLASGALSSSDRPDPQQESCAPAQGQQSQSDPDAGRDPNATIADAKTLAADPKRHPCLWYSEDTGRYELLVGTTLSGVPSTFAVGVRREIWIYLLLAALILSSIEWLTYHRRVTV